MNIKIAAVALATAGISTLSLAAEFTVSGSTLGGFDAQVLGASNSLFGLSYSNSTFNDTTDGGFLGFGGNPNPGSNFNNFGSFTESGPGMFFGHTFSLQITFTSPSTIVGGNAANFTANLLGRVSNTGNGGVNVSWGASADQSFSWANALETGTFSLHLNDVALNPGQTASLTGYIQGQSSPVPEPASMTALALGALALVRRRRTSR